MGHFCFLLLHNQIISNSFFFEDPTTSLQGRIMFTTSSSLGRLYFLLLATYYIIQLQEPIVCNAFYVLLLLYNLEKFESI